ncbi:hypothetical protein Q5H92_22745 [Hymenobacter sp. M29]|uniref:Uncharacterized protein n=1 Tax=Hymenobacter mellowenesis TaxID=3063995 RepID=A0ABT9AJB2_9BACT|nr:hypothetical protein [Hymenobacter sp. M29]MDO7849200.1 hypothetical protein [Hymenobacter sp. M29]
MDLQAELNAKRLELASTEQLISQLTKDREGLRPGPGYGDAKQQLTDSILRHTKASARLQREIKSLNTALTESLQPKLL